MSEDLYLFSGGAALLCVFGLLSIWAPEFRAVAATQLGVLIGAAAMKMKGNQ